MNANLFSIEAWARSARNREIALYASKNLHNITPNDAILMIGGTHGDEPEGVRLAKDLLAHLSQKVSFKQDWVLIPNLNPDGYSERERRNGNLVDLNRNYPASNWELSKSGDRYFSGPSPASEPETKAVVGLIEQIKPKLIIHFHSWKPMILYAGNSFAQDVAEQLGKSSKYEVKEDIGYPCPGSLSDWAWGDLKIPVICVEEKEGLTLDLVWGNYRDFMLGFF
ncbi:MAG: DUF2817 domain-containing protein [Bdellovibrionales bacterium]